MKQTNWNVNTNKVRAWAENQPKSDNLSAVLLSLSLGDNATSDELRSTYWTAIRSIGSTMEGFPSARKGLPSALNEAQQIALASVEEQVKTAFASIPTEYHATLLAVVVPHGRTGGVYESMEALTQHYVDASHNYMMSSIKEERWNGEKMNKAGVPQITPRPTKAEKDAQESEATEEV